MAKTLGVFLLLIIISVSLVSARAASVEDFYKGKTIQFVVGGTLSTFRANRPLSFKICLEPPC